jgi:hypothetical protein
LRLELSRERLVRSLGGSSPTELIDGGISQSAIEPRNNRLVRRRLFGPRDDLGERILQDVLCEGVVADAIITPAASRGE